MTDATHAPTGTPGTSPTEAAPRRRWWLRALVLTAALLLVAEAGVRLGASKLGDPLVWYSRTAQNKAEALAAADRDRDVVFAGSSVVAASLDPSIFMDADACGRTAYNASTAGAVPTITADWLDRAVLPNTRSTVVVLGITPRDLSESAASAATPYFDSAAVRDDLGGRLDRWFSRWSYLVKYRNTIRNPVTMKGRIDELRGADAGLADYDENGFRRLDNADQQDTATQQTNAGLTLDREQVRALDRLVVELKERGVVPVLAAMGASENYSSTATAKRLVAAADAAVDDIARRRDVPLVDLRDVSDPKYFVDLVHTNSAGSKLETERLTEELASIGCDG